MKFMSMHTNHLTYSLTKHGASQLNSGSPILGILADYLFTCSVLLKDVLLIRFDFYIYIDREIYRERHKYTPGVHIVLVM